MKKVLLFVFLAALLSVCSAFAQDMGVQLISAPEIAAETVFLDDLKLDSEAEIDGWGILKITLFEFIDKFEIYYSGSKSNSHWVESGADAEYAFLKMDITNTALSSKNFLKDAVVKVIYDDVYEYAGWAYQFNLNNAYITPYKPVDKEDSFDIDPMYQGHYVFGCTLPNAVVNSKKTLRMEIMIDGNELTYNIRK